MKKRKCHNDFLQKIRSKSKFKKLQKNVQMYLHKYLSDQAYKLSNNDVFLVLGKLKFHTISGEVSSGTLLPPPPPKGSNGSFATKIRCKHFKMHLAWKYPSQNSVLLIHLDFQYIPFLFLAAEKAASNESSPCLNGSA